jgi:hypothetical protein
MYHISSDVVASALKIPRVAQLGYPYIGQLVPLRDSMMELFCGKTIVWGTKKTNTTTEFTCEARLFNLVMSHNLLPVSHRNTFELRQAQFLYALMTGVSIDLPSVICNSFITMHQSKDASLSLIHPCAITRILTHLNMNFLAAIPLVTRSVQPINRHSITRIAAQMQKQKKLTREVDNDEEDDATGPSYVADVRAELKSIVSYLDRISSQLNAQQTVLGKLNTRMRRLEQRAMDSSSGATCTPSASSTYGIEADGSEADAAVEGDHYDKNDDIDDDDDEDEDEEDEDDEHGSPK